MSSTKRLALAITLVIILVIIVIAGCSKGQLILSDELEADLYQNNFLDSITPEARLDNLAGLFKLNGYEDVACDLFFDLNSDQQMTLFEELENPQQVGQDVLIVVKGVYQDYRLEDNVTQDQLLQTMARVLHQVEEKDAPGAQVTAIEIDHWVEGHERADKNDFAGAVEQYTLSLKKNRGNAAVLLDRGQGYIALGEYEAALIDLQNVVELNPAREERVRQIIYQDHGLFTYVGLHRQEYQGFATWFPTLTPTSPPTNIPTPTTNRPTPTTHTPSPITTPTKTSSPTPTPEPKGIVTSQILNVRAGPGIHYEVVGQLKQGDSITIVARTFDADWLQIRYEEELRWVIASSVDTNDSLDSIPVTDDIPPTPILPDLDGTWMGSTSHGGTIMFVVSGRQVTIIESTYPPDVSRELVGDCAGVTPCFGGFSRITLLHISIGADGSFVARNIQVRNVDRTLVEFSGVLQSDGTGYGQLQEDRPDFQVPTCIHRSLFEWSVTRQ
ncbi:MAG: SH3 domain-containing protein [Chloroflexi bacterium]|nr:SH3 domain-containing protein [Chloroflexota bacterium]